jgi:hypothetical protein
LRGFARAAFVSIGSLRSVHAKRRPAFPRPSDSESACGVMP